MPSRAVIVYRTGPDRTRDTKPDRPQVQEDGADVESIGDLTDAVEKDRVTGDPQRTVGLSVPP